MYLEEPGTEEHGFEFSLAVGDATEYHQVKRQRAGDAGWKLGALGSAGVLGAFRAKLASPATVCVFASGNAAQSLDDLATLAAKAESWDSFNRTVLKYETRSSRFQELRELWEASELWTFESLRRVRVETIGERQLGHMLRLETELLLVGAIENAPAVLIEILRGRVGERVDALILWADLDNAGFRPNPWRSSPELAARLRTVNDDFSRSRRKTLIGNELISRPETTRSERHSPRTGSFSSREPRAPARATSCTSCRSSWRTRPSRTSSSASTARDRPRHQRCWAPRWVYRSRRRRRLRASAGKGGAC